MQAYSHASFQYACCLFCSVWPCRALYVLPLVAIAACKVGPPLQFCCPDLKLLLQGSNESSDDENAPRQSQIYSDGETDPGITDPGITDPGITLSGLSEHADGGHSRRHSIDPMTSMGSTAFWDPPDLQHPANTNKAIDSATVSDSSGADPSHGGSTASAQSVAVKVSSGSKRIARVRKRHLGMLQTMLEASRRAAEFVTSVR